MTEGERSAYFAGFIDGEGSFTIGNSLSMCPQLAVANTNIKTLEFLEETYGGGINTRPLYKNWKQCYGWSLQGRALIPIVRDILPFLVMKREQAVLTIALAETMGTPKVTVDDATIVKRMVLSERLRALNKKGREVDDSTSE